MNKKLIIGIIVVLIVLGIIWCAQIIKKPKENISNSNISEMEKNGTNMNIENNTNTSTENKKVLVVYYSAQNHTKAVAEKIAANLNADIFEIVPENVYTSEDLNWSNSNSRVSKEHNDESLRDVKLKSTKVDSWGNYDTILIGYPIWWGIAAWPVNTFLKDNDFTGKTVIPFCTSSSSGMGQSGKNLETMANGGTWLEGRRFSSSVSDSVIKEWTDSLK